MTMPTIELGEVLTDAQIKNLKTAKTAADIRRIVHGDTSKYQDIFDPDYLTYAIMYVLGISS